MKVGRRSFLAALMSPVLAPLAIRQPIMRLRNGAQIAYTHDAQRRFMESEIPEVMYSGGRGWGASYRSPGTFFLSRDGLFGVGADGTLQKISQPMEFV